MPPPPALLEKGGILEKAASLVSFSDDSDSIQRWERSASVQLVASESKDAGGVVEANFHYLLRDFGACVAIPLLYGQDFLDRCPQLLDDFWCFDNDLFMLRMLRVPTWAPLGVMKKGLRARANLLKALEALFRRVDQHSRGQPVDYDAYMSDISSVALARNAAYSREEFTFQERAASELGLLWGQNANTQPMVFWLLTYIYSTPNLLGEVRKETASYMKVFQSSPPTIDSMDLAGLGRACPLLKACLFETYRMANETASIRHVVQPITVNDGVHKHQLRPGMFVTAVHSVHQRDPSVYADPDKFMPERFLETDPTTSEQVARYGKLKPWGSGPSSCKGRTFAEKEMLAIAAAVITLWDIEAVGNEWKIPAQIPGTGVMKPVEDIRVRIRRRAFDKALLD